jgi:3-deoxy-D-manno-octulosonate 8-phosphate phosphatase (KDO 8-P phosphatase)
MDIKLIIYDFDGVMTDNMVYVDSNGLESVRCCRADGLGVDIIRNMDIPQWILSTEKNKVVQRRAEKLYIPFSAGCGEKAQGVDAIKWYCGAIEFKDTLYVGNDINDLEAMKLCGHRACPSDAHPEIKAVCNIQLKSKGGEGVVRELADILKEGL